MCPYNTLFNKRAYNVGMMMTHTVFRSQKNNNNK